MRLDHDSGSHARQYEGISPSTSVRTRQGRTEGGLDYEPLVSLTEERGVPGYADCVRDRGREAIEPHVDRGRPDAMGNLVGTVEGEANYDVVAAHMDQIGVVVRHVDDDGVLELDALGGWDPRELRAQRVTVHAEGRPAGRHRFGTAAHARRGGPRGRGVSRRRPRRPRAGRRRRRGARLGRRPGLDGPVDDPRRRVVTGRSLENRVSVLVMPEAARRLASPSATVYFAATTQEEVGLRGAEALGVDLDPDLVLAVNTTVANDVPGFEAGERVTELGEGVAIKLKNSSVITNHKVHRRLRDVAESGDVDHQFEVLPSGGTDTGGLQRSGGATPAGAISVPTRYLHTPTESVHEDDVTATVDLLVGFLDNRGRRPRLHAVGPTLLTATRRRRAVGRNPGRTVRAPRFGSAVPCVRVWAPPATRPVESLSRVWATVSRSLRSSPRPTFAPTRTDGYSKASIRERAVGARAVPRRRAERAAGLFSSTFFAGGRVGARSAPTRPPGKRSL